ncbi:MFS transporter [Castellaniella sp.]|uniref:MFS transporter n=1 Tax=Castellaniella sp. TaxID=1955812 RepID=UPI002AFDD8D6|nr:MFS transporter [Castellaniella sp.]
MTSSSLSRPSSDYRPDPGRWRILVILLTTIFMSLIGVSIVNVALPSIHTALQASQADMQWVLSGYALTFGVVLVAAGRAGDLMGRGGLFLIGVALFTLSSIAAGLAPDATWLNGARFVQGVGSGLLNPQGLGMIQHYFRGAERGRAFGYLGTVVGFSVAIGPVLGGLLIEIGGLELGWRLTFLVNVPIGLVVIFLGFKWFPRPLIQLPRQRPAPARIQAIENNQATDMAGAPDSQAAARLGWRSLDPIGSLLLGLAVLSVLYPFVESRSSPLTWLLLPLGLLLTLSWVRWERHTANQGGSPMVNLQIFSTASFSNGVLIMALYFLGMTSIWVLVALYVQEGLGMTALQSGMFGVPAALLSSWAANWAGRRVMTYGRKIVIGGLLLALIGLMLSILVIFLEAQGRISAWWLLLTLSFIGLAQGAVISPNQTLTLMDVPLDYAGSSGAIMQTGQRIGTSVGIAMITAAVFWSLNSASWPIATMVGFGVIIAVVLVALLVAIQDQRIRQCRITGVIPD